MFAEAQLGRLELARGDVAAAIERLTPLVDEASAAGNPYVIAEVAVHLAAAQIASGSGESALRTIEGARDAAGDEVAFVGVPLFRVEASALMALGRMQEAHLSLDAAITGARDQGLLFEELLALRLATDLATHDQRTVSPEELERLAGLLELLGIDETN